ncbi:uncharacterized protein LOC126895005 [Daktulosphaira vitifoliae]|uniref:uncharacterized protein LOC126895005 n=1 Tax=Daktulosphaira vitifoliae TaxID=58002 RepID=UPI0021AAFFDF|nr:uncharacterized protein LOC126895005 [Daktulosphaira vitifoliae]
MQLAIFKLEENANNKGQISESKMFEVLNESSPINFERRTANYNLEGNYSDGVMVDLLQLAKKTFNFMKMIEDAFFEQLRKGDEKQNGFVSKEYAKEVIFNCKFFDGRNKDDRLNRLLGKYTNEQNQFNYLEMKKNVLDDIESDKSKIYSYNYKKKKWVRKYKFTPTHCL